MALIVWLEEIIELFEEHFQTAMKTVGISLTSFVSLALRVTSGLTQLRPRCPHDLLDSGG